MKPLYGNVKLQSRGTVIPGCVPCKGNRLNKVSKVRVAPANRVWFFSQPGRSRKPELIFFATTIALLAVSVALGQQIGSAQAPPPKKDSSVYAELAKAPDKVRAKRNPLESDPDAVVAGRNLFEQHCGECHGDTAEGGKKGPSLRAEQVQNAAPGAVFWLLTNGVVRRGMPVWSKLPEPQRWQLVAYIKSLGTKPANPM